MRLLSSAVVGTLFVAVLPSPVAAAPLTVAIDATISLQPDGPPAFDPLTGGVMHFFQTSCAGDTCLSYDLGSLNMGESFQPADPRLSDGPMLLGTPLLLTIRGLASGLPAYGYPSDAASAC